MARVTFTVNLQRHVSCPEIDVRGVTVRDVLDGVFAVNPAVRSYVLDEHGALRKHMAVFVDGEQVADRVGLSDRVLDDAEIYVMQALSGG